MVGSIHIPDADEILEVAQSGFSTIEIPDLSSDSAQVQQQPQQQLPTTNLQRTASELRSHQHSHRVHTGHHSRQQQNPKQPQKQQQQQIKSPKMNSSPTADIVIPDSIDDMYDRQPMNFKMGSPPPTTEDLVRQPSISTNPNQSPLSRKPSTFNNQLLEQRANLTRAPTLKNKPSNPPSYTLNIMVRQFTKYAERKLSLCLNSAPLDQEPDIIDLLSEGVDPTFDKIITSLGYIARRKPRRVTDAVMHWRRGKSELREMARSMLEKEYAIYKDYEDSSNKRSTAQAPPKLLTHKKSLSFTRSVSYTSRQASGSISSTTIMDSKDGQLKDLKSRVQKAEITYTQADRQFTISTYILWRVLIEVVKQTPTAILTEDTGLEEIMYNYLRNIDPKLVAKSAIQSANWNLLAELIGRMSEKSFLNVSDRFIADLEKFPTGYTNNNGGMNEAGLNLLIHGMRYLQFSNSSLERFEEGADFMKSLAKFFFRCQNENILISYCEVINQLLLSLAGTLTAEVNHPTWVEAIKIIYSKSLEIANTKSNKYWKSAATLVSTSISVAPKEMFEKNWLDIANANIKKLKPKLPTSEKVVILTCLGRLIWAYLYRYSDTLNAKTRNLENLADLLFQNHNNKKQHWLTHDTLLIQAAVQILRAMAFSQLNLTLENIVLPIIKSSFNNVNLENLSHEKLLLAIRSYSCILSDYQSNERPPFPTDDVIQSSLDPMEFVNVESTDIFEKSPSNAAVHTEVSTIFTNLLFLLDSQCSSKVLENSTTSSGSAPTTPISPNSTLTPTLSIKLSSFYFHNDDNTNKLMELFSTIISGVTWYSQTNPSSYKGKGRSTYTQIVELLVKNCVHEDDNLNSFCIDNLKILVTKNSPNVIMTSFVRIAFFLDEKVSGNLNHEYLSSNDYIKLLEIYVELLQSWLDSLTETSKTSVETPNEMYNVNHEFVQKEIHESKTFEELDLKSMANMIDEVEGNGLFFLFSHDFNVRFLGSQILRMVAQFDEVIYYLTTDTDTASSTLTGMRTRLLNTNTMTSSIGAESGEFIKTHNRMPSKFVADVGTRIIQVLENMDFFALVGSKKGILSEAETKRLARLQHKQRKDTIIRLAESNHGVDAALWFKIFEEVLESLVTQCPMAIAVARSHSCIRLVQLYNQVVSLSTGTSSGGTANSLIWDYMLFLKVSCSSLTSTSQQQVHIPAISPSSQNTVLSPLSKTHARKKSQQLFTVQHQKITSAMSIFKMVVPLLTTTNSKLKDALVEGLSCLNINIFESFLESIETIMEKWKFDSNGRKISPDTKLKIEICGILNKVMAKFCKTEDEFMSEWSLSRIQLILSNVKRLLILPYSQTNFEYQRLRKCFMGIFESFHQEVLKRNQVDTWLPLQFRKESFEFGEEWCGYGDNVNLFNNRYMLMTKDIATHENSVTLQAGLELQKRQLQITAISCMASLLGSPIADQKVTFDVNKILSWFDSLFYTHNEKVVDLARKALLKLLQVNSNSAPIIHEILNKCYTKDPALGNYFIMVNEAFVTGTNFADMYYSPLTLGLFCCGSDNFSVRAAATRMLEHAEKTMYGTNKCSSFVDAICSGSRNIYKRTMFSISSHFATEHPDEKYKMISQITMLFKVVSNSDGRRDLLTILLPWVQTVTLNLEEDDPNRNKSLMVLYNFIEITVNLGHKIQNEVEALWVSLGGGNSNENAKVIYSFITDFCLFSKNLEFLECSRQIMVSISNVQSSLIDTLISNLEPKSMIPVSGKDVYVDLSSSNPDGLPYVADLSRYLTKNTSKSFPTLSLCELSVIFVVDLILNPVDSVKEQLPLLLHLSFVLLDHQLPLIQDQACTMVAHLVRQYGDYSDETTKKIVDTLTSHERQKSLWLHSDLITNKNGGRIPESMDLLVRDVKRVLEPNVANIQKEWSKSAIHWATSCKVMHIASRSFQIFRCLISFLDQSMLRDMLSCLANTISDENPGIQSFALQILMTLNAITAELYSEQLIDFPQLFWSAVASLNTIHELEFIEVLSTLSKFISKIDLDSEETVQCLIATFPPKWEGRFEGLQSLIMIGLRSCNAYEPSLRLLDRLNLLKDSEIIGSGDSRLLMALLANMPRFLHAQTNKRFTEEVVNAANVISSMAETSHITGLSRIITSLVKKRFRNKEDFMAQIVSILKNYFFPTYAAQTLVFLLGLLFNKTSWIKVEIMDFLKHVFRVVDLSSEEFVGLGADLVSPLLRLLLTEFVDNALEVLDEANSISASPFDKHYLMMSAGDATMRKEYEKIATLFGIPDDSGWSIPMPAVNTARTRNNIHSVFSTCTIPVREGETKETVEELPPQFNRDDYVQYNPIAQDQQVMYQQQQSLFQSQHSDADSLSNMLATLENLDSFFTKDSMDIPQQYGHQYNGSVDTKSTMNTTTTTEPTNNWNFNFESPTVNQPPRFSSSSPSFKSHTNGRHRFLRGDILKPKSRIYPSGFSTDRSPEFN